MSQTATETASTATETGTGTSQTKNGGQSTATTTAASTEPYYKDWLQSDGSLNHKSLDRLPDELKDLRSTLERQKNFDGILHDLKHSKFLAGQKALAPLPTDAPAAVRAERKALLDGINGVPKEAKDYGVTRPKDMPEAQWNQGLADNFVKWAHENSVPPQAVQKLLGMQFDAIKGNMQAQAQYETAYWTKEQQAFEGINRQENRPQAQADALVEKGIVAMGLDPKNEKIATLLKGADVRTILMRHAIAIGEDKALTGGDQGKGEGTNYQQQADSILKDPANPLFAAFKNVDGKYSRSDHDAAVAKWHELLKLAEDQKNKARR